MGRHNPGKLKTYFKKNHLTCHKFINNYDVILHSKTDYVNGREREYKESVSTYFVRKFKGWRFFTYYDFAILFIFQLFGLWKWNPEDPTGGKLIDNIMNKITKYQALSPDKIVIGNDGDSKKRPYLKEIRCSANPIITSAADIDVCDEAFTLTQKLWNDNKKDQQVHKKVVHYISNALTKRWAKKFRFTDLVFDAAVIPDKKTKEGSQKELKYGAILVENKIRERIDSANCCEGEQIIYSWIIKNIKYCLRSVHIIEGGTDTDHYLMCILLQEILSFIHITDNIKLQIKHSEKQIHEINDGVKKKKLEDKVKNLKKKLLELQEKKKLNHFTVPRLFLRLKHYGTKLDGETRFYSASTYMVNIFKLNKQIKERITDNVKFNKVLMFALINMAYGNDFVWSYVRSEYVNPRNPSKVIYLNSIIRGVNIDKLMGEAVKLNYQFIRREITESGKVKYRVNKKEFYTLFTNLLKRDPSKDDSVHLYEIINRSEWCLNYFIHPGDPEFFKWDHAKKRQRIEKNGSNKKTKFI